MSAAALIPFILLLICFVGLRFPLTLSSFVALVSGSLLTQFFFTSSVDVWEQALGRTFQIMIEIGFIIFGAFFFLEIAKKVGIIRSLAKLVQEVSSNRLVQGMLVIFPLELMVEGSSGFGTPLLIIAPILQAMGFQPILCAILPFLTCVIGIPFGALGTPVRLGFPGAVDPSHGILIQLLPLLIFAPLLGAFMIKKNLKLKEILWILMLSLVYGSISYSISFSGPEFVALVPAFVTFLVGVASARIVFRSESQTPIKDLQGIYLYGALLITMWLGKQILMDRLIAGTHIRIFNPGFVFLIFGFLLLAIYRNHRAPEIFKATIDRSKRTLFVFFCMTFTVQQLRENGGVNLLNQSIPDFLLHAGSPMLGWLGTLFVGTSTVSNLLTSKVVDPNRFVAIGAGSAIGVQLAFQSIAAMRSNLNDQISEKELFLRVAPISLGFAVIVTTIYAILAQIN